MRRYSRLAVILGVVLLAGLVVYIATDVYQVGGVSVPEPPRVEAREVVHLDQNWTKPQQDWFHHASQGTRILPRSWFLALEQPDLSPYHTPRKFSETDYLARFGFLPSDATGPDNPDGLPVGFAVEEDFRAPVTDPLHGYKRIIGLTCAACHTGQLEYRGDGGVVRAVRIEGGSAMINLAKFQDAAQRAIFFTDLFPARFTRFARRVLKAEGKYPGDEREVAALRKELKAVIRTGLDAQRYAKKKNLFALEAGFSRTDALGLIGNRVFGVDNDENLAVTDAPVNFPHIWGTPWFDWVQYNASIRLPMARNIGEALGVGAVVSVDPKTGKPTDSSVNLPNLHRIEDQLGGDTPYSGLLAPKWPEALFGSIDPVKAERGRALYNQFCVGCHLASTAEIKADLAAAEKGQKSRSWSKGKLDDVYILHVPTSNLEEIGTDPNQALNFYRRVAVSSNKKVSAKEGLYDVTLALRKIFFERLNLDEKAQRQYDRFRRFDPGPRNMGEVILAPLEYKARPLDGIWATPPYFHNSSVPNLYEVLLPAADRSGTFGLGSRIFDKERVGYETDPIYGGFVMDTSLAGNFNTGHEYRNLKVSEIEVARGITYPAEALPSVDQRWANVLHITLEEYRRLSKEDLYRARRKATLAAIPKDKGFKGVVGPELTEDERWALVEYLKSL